MKIQGAWSAHCYGNNMGASCNNTSNPRLQQFPLFQVRKLYSFLGPIDVCKLDSSNFGICCGLWDWKWMHLELGIGSWESLILEFFFLFFCVLFVLQHIYNVTIWIWLWFMSVAFGVCNRHDINKIDKISFLSLFFRFKVLGF
jgi:hypothetical protein